jgi:hypothetical protein
MIAAGESQTFGVYETASCKHCGEDIERRRLIGWLHVGRFFLCAGQSGEDVTVAEPAR